LPHAVTSIPSPWRAASGAFEVHLVPVWRDNLVWLIAPRDTDTAWAVDGPEAGPVLGACARIGRRLAGVLTTHTHPDHVGLHAELARDGQLDGLRVFGSAAAASAIPGLTDAVVDGDVVTFDGLTARVLRTDGHQTGHVCYAIEGALFCGDTLFAGGCGYLFDGPPAAMFESLMRLAALPGPTAVFCAHEYTEENLRFAWMIEPTEALGERIRRVWATRASGGCSVPSTLDEERATNPFLRPGSPTLRAELARRLPDVDMSTHAAVFAATRRLKDLKAHLTIGEESLPLAAPASG
jgi:hydroxyacylglutathione hydrolase